MQPSPHEPIHDIAHLGSVELFTPRFDRSLWYFRDVLGMEQVHTAGDSAWLRGYGDYAAATLKLTGAAHAGPGVIAWRASSAQALERRAEAIGRAGWGIGWNEGEFGRGRSYRFCDPEGHLMEIYYDETRYRAPDHLRSTLKNLPMRFTARGACVRRTDHLALMAHDVAANRRFAQELLGFRLSETVRFEHGTREIGSWLSPSAIHHELAYVMDTSGTRSRLHHFSLWVDNREDVLRAADVLVENGIFIEAGPSRHNNSQAFYLYSYEPGGNRIEVYSGSFLIVAPDWEPVVWNEEERGTGVYWGGALPASFIDYATPQAAVAGQARHGLPVFDPR